MSLTGRRVGAGGGFTLMELLVVIAIIALLVSILMPSLQAAKTLARTAVCQATMHSLALGNAQYMSDNEGFSVHGREYWEWWYNSSNTFNTGYGLPMGPTAMFDDDWGETNRFNPKTTLSIPPASPGQAGTVGSDGNEALGSMQNICGTGQLMYDKYIEETVAAIGCPQADFTEITPFTGPTGIQEPGHNYQYVKEIMGYPRLDPNKSYSGGGVNDPNTDPNAYWRNDFYGGTGNGWGDKRYVSNYAVRGPMFRSGDVLEQNHIGYLEQYFPANARPKADSQVALFADHEWAIQILHNWDPYGLVAMGYDKPASTYFPRRHTAGPVVAYTDGHVAVFQDETRRKTWNATGKYEGNQTHWYGNSWALINHVFDEE